jgi:hypothetical protein
VWSGFPKGSCAKPTKARTRLGKTKATPRHRHNKLSAASLRAVMRVGQSAANAVFAAEFPGSARKTSSNAHARFWFQSEEIMTGTILMNGS